MNLTKIEISKYKSIKKPIVLEFKGGKPLVLIGKNGSGKTNILEALDIILNRKTAYYSGGKPLFPECKIDIKLSEKDLKSILPEAVYDKKRCVLTAYCNSKTYGLIVDTLQSDYIVPEIRNEICSIKKSLDELEALTDKYEKSLSEIFGENKAPLRIVGVSGIEDLNEISRNIEWAKESLEKISASCEFDLDEIRSYSDRRYFSDKPIKLHSLEYVARKLTPIEEDCIRIDEEKLKKKISEFNENSLGMQTEINSLIEKINSSVKRLCGVANEQDERRYEDGQRYKSFMCQVNDCIARKCSFLRNEYNDLISGVGFDEKSYYKKRDYSRVMLETYLIYGYKGERKEELLKNTRSSGQIELGEDERQGFETFLNRELGDFEKKSHNGVYVDEYGNVNIEELTGDIVPLESTSMGRRWYFAYFIMKRNLSRGDWLLIDEPAAFHHPSARKEILAELEGLAKRGVNVVYSTHNSEFIPTDLECVNFVTIGEDGTSLSPFRISSEKFKDFRASSVGDIFAYSEALDYYEKSKFKERIATKIYGAIQKAEDSVLKAAEKIGISKNAVYKWRDGNKIDFDNLIKVSIILNRDLLELIKESEL